RFHSHRAHPDADSHAAGARSRHPSGLFRRPVHHEQRHRPHYAPGRHRAERRLGRGPRADGQGHGRSGSLHHRPDAGAHPAHPIPGHRAAALGVAARVTTQHRRKSMKTTSLMLATALALVLAAPAHAQFQERTLRVSNTVTEIHAVGEGLAAMGACLAERSDGKLKLQPFWGGALGSDGQATQALRSGTLEMVTTATSSLGGITAKAGLFDLPYLVNS